MRSIMVNSVFQNQLVYTENTFKNVNLSLTEKIVSVIALAIFSFLTIFLIRKAYFKAQRVNLDLPDGQRFEGIFQSSIFNEGKFIRDKKEYLIKGDYHLKNGLLSGIGQIIFPNKLKFEGHCEEESLKDGEITCPNGVIFSVQGEFTVAQDLLSGKGKIKPKNVKTYEYDGTVENGNPLKGTLQWPGGIVWEVDFFSNPPFTGKGKIKFRDGTVFEGDFENQKPVKGKITWPNKDKYEGQVDENLRVNGKGKFEKHEGDVLEGTFKDWLPNRKGEVLRNDGTLLQGLFEEGVLVDGLIKHADGKEEKGEFRYGRLHGRGSIVDREGKKVEGYFNKGQQCNSPPRKVRFEEKSD